MTFFGLLVYLLVGLIIGMFARALVAGNHRLGCFGTAGLGILGSFVGGTLWSVLSGNGLRLSAAGFIGSVFGAVIVLVAAKKLAPDKTN